MPTTRWKARIGASPTVITTMGAMEILAAVDGNTATRGRPVPDSHTHLSPQSPRTCLALGHVEEPSHPRGAAPRPSRTPEHARLRLPRLVRSRPDAPLPAPSPVHHDLPLASAHLHLVDPHADHHDELPPGTCLGRHVLVRLRSEGGTCRIYDAEHVQHGHRAVARVPRRDVLRAHAWIAERMLDNAALLADAPHPGVVAIYDYGWTDEAEPRPFMITERIVGQDLAAVLEEQGPLPWRQVVEFAREIAGALHHFHGLGVVHGDLKPGNIMLTAEGSRTSASTSPAGERPVAVSRDLSPRTGSSTAPGERESMPFDDAWDAAPRRQPSLLASARAPASWTLAVALLGVALLAWALLGAGRSSPAPSERAEPPASEFSTAASVGAVGGSSTTATSPSESNVSDAPTPVAPVPVSGDRIEDRSDASAKPASAAGQATRPVEPGTSARSTHPEKPNDSAEKRRSTSRSPARRTDAPLPTLDEDPEDAASPDEDADASILAFRAAAEATSRFGGAGTREVKTSPSEPTRASQPDRVVVPGVTYRPLADAERTLAAAGLTASTRTILHPRCDDHPVGTVVAQDPAPGGRLDADLPVILRVCGERATSE